MPIFFIFFYRKRLNFSFEDYTCFELFNFPIFFLARWKTIKNLFLTITINHFHAFTLTGTIPLNTPLFHLSLTQNTISTASFDNYFHLRRPYSPSSSVIIFHPPFNDPMRSNELDPANYSNFYETWFTTRLLNQAS